MAEAFDILPGIVLPVREITDRLASMWETDDPDSPLTSYALQMNVVLHFGLDIKPEAAREQFNALVRFAQRYPSRIIVLCPTHVNLENSMESKLFSQCYIGESHREMCCCEALILRYNPQDSQYLFINQVSIWLEGDLPTYYWFGEVSAKEIVGHLNAILKLGVHRCVFDSSVESSRLDVLNWPDGFQVNDLAEARLLPVRQSIGQFLNQYSIHSICSGLKAVQISYSEALGEGRALMEWIRSCLGECKTLEKDFVHQPEFSLKKFEQESVYTLEVKFCYDNRKYFMFGKLKDGLRSEIKANLGESDEVVCTPIKSLSVEQTLAEAFFFK